MPKSPQSLIKDCRGTSSVEYGFILVVIVLAIMSALSGFADESVSLWTDVAEKSADAIGS